VCPVAVVVVVAGANVDAEHAVELAINVDADVDADALPCAVTAHEWHDVVAAPMCVVLGKHFK